MLCRMSVAPAALPLRRRLAWHMAGHRSGGMSGCCQSVMNTVDADNAPNMSMRQVCGDAWQSDEAYRNDDCDWLDIRNRRKPISVCDVGNFIECGDSSVACQFCSFDDDDRPDGARAKPPKGRGHWVRSHCKVRVHARRGVWIADHDPHGALAHSCGGPTSLGTWRADSATSALAGLVVLHTITKTTDRMFKCDCGDGPRRLASVRKPAPSWPWRILALSRHGHRFTALASHPT